MGNMADMQDSTSLKAGNNHAVTLSEFLAFKNKVVDIYRPLFDPKIDPQEMAYLLSLCTDELRDELIDLLATDSKPSKSNSKAQP